MSESVPIIIIVIALLLVLVVFLGIRNWEKIKQPIFSNKKSFFPLFLIGIVLSLTAAFFMFDGDILGENTTGIAIVTGIIGIGLIATSNFTLLKR
ncbi:MAG: hypothetical protein JSU79_10830 [Dehalococcoidales bacterium]|nr:MAG: hypothetical protein JSU79_10830 [Dehalococcoidales bacterium]